MSLGLAACANADSSRDAGDSAHIRLASAAGGHAVTSWKALRDDRLVRQEHDASCGAASVATILNQFYGKSVTEMDVLDAFEDDGGMRASFDDMAAMLPAFGFRGVGYAVSYDQLTQLRMPVIVHLQHRLDDHFAVLRGINAETVWLADPGLGNTTYSREQFLEMWNTREDEVLTGRILAILPEDESTPVADDFFTHEPVRQTARAVGLGAFHPHN